MADEHLLLQLHFSVKLLNLLENDGVI